VLWLSGPTGTGKTELAKTVAELIFGDENAIVRFDCAEFADAHSDARLIGSPPGYVGHESGGELTEAVREKPFSVILLDEIEKAHPRILDKFLAILDDGRLSDGQGRTINFSETVIIFSSNLGMSDRTAGGSGESGAGYTLSTPFDVLEKGVRNAVEVHFVRHLGRPELLGRIGKENIFVFDFIRKDVAAEILAKMVSQVLDRTEENTGIRVVLSDTARDDLRRLCLDDDVLQLGGRGIAKKLEAVFTTRLADLLFDRLDGADKECKILSITAEEIGIE
jgi:ATP-dependent Clp protease ATP-binding subunit ClpA